MHSSLSSLLPVYVTLPRRVKSDRLLGAREWWLASDSKPWHPEAVTVVSDRLVFKPRLASSVA